MKSTWKLVFFQWILRGVVTIWEQFMMACVRYITFNPGLHANIFETLMHASSPYKGFIKRICNLKRFQSQTRPRLLIRFKRKINLSPSRTKPQGYKLLRLCQKPLRYEESLFCFVWMDAFLREGNGYPIRDFTSRPETDQSFLLS